MYCVHCGRKQEIRFIGNYKRKDGWSEDIIKRAARATGLGMYAGASRNCNGQDWVGVLTTEELWQNLGPFWNKAKDLILMKTDCMEYNRRRIAELARIQKGNVIRVVGEQKPDTIGEMVKGDVGYAMPAAYDSATNVLNQRHRIVEKPNGIDTMFVRCLGKGSYKIQFN